MIFSIFLYFLVISTSFTLFSSIFQENHHSHHRTHAELTFSDDPNPEVIDRFCILVLQRELFLIGLL